MGRRRPSLFKHRRQPCKRLPMRRLRPIMPRRPLITPLLVIMAAARKTDGEFEADRLEAYLSYLPSVAAAGVRSIFVTSSTV